MTYSSANRMELVIAWRAAKQVPVGRHTLRRSLATLLILDKKDVRMASPLKFPEKLKAKSTPASVGLLISNQNGGAFLIANFRGARRCPDATRRN